MRRARFVGGPLHGEIRALRDDPTRFDVPVYNHKAPWVDKYLDATAAFEPLHVDRLTYVRRPLQLGPWARVDLWAPDNMSEPEFMRRVADLLEGVNEPPKR